VQSENTQAAVRHDMQQRAVPVPRGAPHRPPGGTVHRSILHATARVVRRGTRKTEKRRTACQYAARPGSVRSFRLSRPAP
jgi:hypothetical protein